MRGMECIRSTRRIRGGGAAEAKDDGDDDEWKLGTGENTEYWGRLNGVFEAWLETGSYIKRYEAGVTIS